MSDFPRPSSRVAARTGLAKIRNLSKSEDTEKQSEIAKEMPTGWFYNQNQEKDFWSSLEKPMPRVYDDDKIDPEKQERCFTDLSSATNRIHQLISTFESIDQETAMELANYFDSDEDVTNLNKGEIMSEAKNHVVLNIDELDEISQSQQTLIESLRNWFKDHDYFHIDEANDTIPNVQETFDFLNNLLREYTEKSEKASFLHNDVTEMWTKRVVNMKRLLCARDDEIRNLKESIEQMQAVKSRKQKKKDIEQKDKQLIKEKDKQIEAQIRLIAEQKNQIQNLKGSLRNAQVEKIASDLSSSAPSDKIEDIDSMREKSEQKIAELARETVIVQQNEKIENLMNKIEKLRNDLKVQRDNIEILTQKIRTREADLGEKDITIQKYIKLLTIERDKKKEVTESTPNINYFERDENYEQMIQMQKRMDKLNEAHKLELKKQAEVYMENFKREKMELLAAIEAPDNQALLTSIVKENDAKMEKLINDQAEELRSHQEMYQNKISILTRQYEYRLKTMSTQHQKEVNTLKEDQDYQIKKIGLELECKTESDILEMTNSREKQISELQKRINELEDNNFLYKKQNEMFRTTIQRLEPDSEVLDQEVIPERRPSVSTVVDQDLYIKKLIEKSQIIKGELQEQHEWELETLRNKYESDYEKKKFALQIGARDALTKVQTIIEETDINKDPKPIKDAVVNALIQLNNQINVNQEEEDIDAPADEFNRTRQMVDKLTLLKTENNDLKYKVDEMREKAEKILLANERLKNKNDFLESTKSDDQEVMAAKLDQLQKYFDDKIDDKNKEINQLQGLLSLEKERDYVLYTIPVLDMYVEDENDLIIDYEEEEENVVNEEEEEVNNNEEGQQVEEEVVEIEEEEEEEEELPTREEVEEDDVPTKEQVEDPKEAKEEPQVEVKEIPVQNGEEEVEVKEKSVKPKKKKTTKVKKEPVKPKKKKVVKAKKEPVKPIKKTKKSKKEEKSNSIETIKEETEVKEDPVKEEEKVEEEKVEAVEPKKEEEKVEQSSEVPLISIKKTRSRPIKLSRCDSDKLFKDQITSKTNLLDSSRRRYRIAQRAAVIKVSTDSQTDPIDDYTSNYTVEIPELSIEEGDSFAITENKAEFNVPEKIATPKPVVKPNPRPIRIKRLKFSPMIILNRPDNFVPKKSADEIEKPKISRPFEDSAYLIFTQTNVDITVSGRRFAAVQVNDHESRKMKEKIEELRDELALKTKQVREVLGSLNDQKEKEKCLRMMAEAEKKANEELMKREEDLLEKAMQARLDAEEARKQLENAISNEARDSTNDLPAPIENAPIPIDDLPPPVIIVKEVKNIPLEQDKSIPRVDLNRVDSTKIFDKVDKEQSPQKEEEEKHEDPINAPIPETPSEQEHEEEEHKDEKFTVDRDYKLIIEVQEEEPIPNVKECKDVLNQSIQLLGRLMKYSSAMRKDFNTISQTLDSDSKGYESYMQATGGADHNLETYIHNVNNALFNYDKLLYFYDYHLNLYNAIASLIRRAQTKHKILLKRMDELEERAENSKLDESKMILDDLKNNTHMENSFVLNRISSALATVQDLNIELSPHDLVKFQELTKICGNYINEKTNDKELINKLLIDTQVYIDSIKSSNIKESNTLKIASMEELELTKKALERAREQINKLQKEVQKEKDVIKAHVIEKSVLRQRIEEEELKQNEQLSIYKAQISTLNELFDGISTDSGYSSSAPFNKNIKTMTQKIKEQVINLQVLLDTTISEKKAAETKAFEFEDLYNKTERKLVELRHDLQEAREVQSKLETKVTKYRHEALVHEADIEKLKDEAKVLNEGKEDISKEIEIMQQKVDSLVKENNELEKEKDFLKQMVVSIETDTDTHSLEKEIRELLKPTEKEDKEVQTNEDIPIKEVCLDNIPMSVSFVNEEEEDLRDKERIKLTSRSEYVFNSRQSLPVNRETVAFPQRQKLKPLPSKGFSTSRSGSRASHVILKPVKCGSRISSRSTPFRNESVLSNLPPIHAKHFDFQREPEMQSSTMERPKTAMSVSSQQPINTDTETIRITNINFPQQNTQKRAPLVSPINVEKQSTIDPFTMKGSTMVVTKEFNTSELMKKFDRLKTKMREIIESSEKKDALISELKNKLVEITLQLQQSRIETLRTKDESRKTSIKSKDVDQRLRVTTSELSELSQEAYELRMQLYKYKAYVGSIDSSLSMYDRARTQKQISTRASAIESNTIEQTKNNVNRAKNEATKKHLLMMLENHRESRARHEAKRRMWEEQEKQQITKALEAMFLIDTGNSVDSIILPFSGPFVYKPIKLPEAFTNEDENDFGGDNIEKIDLSITGNAQ